MRKSWLNLCLVCTAIALLFSKSASATEAGLVMPLIDGTPKFADFQNMAPSSALARSMTKVDSFVQREPKPGEPSAQRTEVYIGYDQLELHVVFLAFDTDPDQIRANLSSRENIDGDDHVEITFDTFNDQRAAFSFRTTALGIQWDARWTEGSSRRAGFDTTLEMVWESEGELTDQGYMARMSIPLRSLRFPDNSEQEWRIQFARNIPRLGEESYWPPYSVNVEGRLNQTATLTGIRDVSPGNNSQIIPFLFMREVDALDPDATGGPKFEQSSEQNVGLDAKFVFNDSMVLDITLNPDFSQVESDEPQVTLNQRFEVQFPERRPFFVENADFFATDSTLVFTRRIIDPEGGARFTGREGKFGFGSILINDEAPGLNRADDDPLKGEKANIAILRGFMDISEQDRVGVLLTNRSLADGHNRVASIDGRFKLTSNWTTQMQFIGTESKAFDENEETTGYQRNIQINRAGRSFSNHTHFVETTSNFRTELGFQSRFTRSDTTGVHQRMNYNFYPENSSINRWNVRLFGVHLNDIGGDKIYSELEPRIGVNFDTNVFTASYSEHSETLRPKDFAGIVSNRTYKYEDFSLSFTNTTLNTLSFEADLRVGTTLNLVPPTGTLPNIADTTRFSADMLWRPIDRLSISNTLFHTELETESGGMAIFTNDIFRSNWNYQFTKEWSLRFIAQYDETDAGPASSLVDDKNLNFDLLLRYVINPWSAFYIGYNSNQSNFDIVEMEDERELVVANDLRNDGDQIFMKFSYLFQR